MKKIIALIFVGLQLWNSNAFAIENNIPPSVSFSSKYRSVEYLFTHRAEKEAEFDGSNYSFAIQEVGWELISAIGRACSSVKNIEAIYIDRINFKGRHSFVVLGILADQKYHTLRSKLPMSDRAVEELLQALKREKVSVVQLNGSKAVELLISSN